MSFSALVPSIFLCYQRHPSKTQIWSCHFPSYKPSVPAHCSRDNVLNPLVRLTCVHDLDHQLSLANPSFSLKTSTLETSLILSSAFHHNGCRHLALKYFTCYKRTINISVPLFGTPWGQRLCLTFCPIAIWRHDGQHWGKVEMLKEWTQLDVESRLHLILRPFVLYFHGSSLLIDFEGRKAVSIYLPVSEASV